MTKYFRAKRQERRLTRGLQRRYGRVVPPSLGKRHVEIPDTALTRFEEFWGFLEEHKGRVRCLGRSEYHVPISRLRDVYRWGGEYHLVMFNFPENYLLEMDDDDILETVFRLLF